MAMTKIPAAARAAFDRWLEAEAKWCSFAASVIHVQRNANDRLTQAIDTVSAALAGEAHRHARDLLLMLFSLPEAERNAIGARLLERSFGDGMLVDRLLVQQGSEGTAAIRTEEIDALRDEIRSAIARMSRSMGSIVGVE